MTTINGTDGNDLFRITDNPVGADEFFLGAGNDFVFANIGADSYFGGDGIDSVSYRFAASSVTLNLATGGTGGIAAGDIYDSIERIFGSNFDDFITGSLSADFLYGGLGNDTLNGDNGNDRLFGQDGNDIINGGNGNDYIEGGDGADTINGGAGIDTIGFTTASEGVTVNLSTALPLPPTSPPSSSPQAEPSQSGPSEPVLSNAALGDTYVSIENISGSNFDDDLTGDTLANLINGRAGDDFLRGLEGNDILIGGLGADTIFGDEGSDNLQGGSGNDEIFGGEGNDRIFLGEGEDYAEGGEGNDFFFLTNDGVSDEVYGGNNTDGDGPNTDNGFDTVSYIQATAGVEVFLGGLIPLFPLFPDSAEPLDPELDIVDFESDILIGIERIIGSNFDDTIFGGFEDETIFGGNGDDTLDGNGGRDRLIGGNGADDFGFTIGDSDVDAILDFEQGVDTITFFTFDEGLTEADILATIVDFGTHFVFEFGVIEDGSPLEQRLSVIKDDPDLVLTVDDFTIILLDDGLLEPLFQEPFEDISGSEVFTEMGIDSYDLDALI